MKKFGKITLTVCLVFGLLALSSCNFYSTSKSVAAFERTETEEADGISSATATVQIAFDKDNTVSETMKMKVAIFSVKGTADGTWKTLDGNGPASDDISYGTMEMEALTISILGQEEDVSEAGTYYWLVYDKKLYIASEDSIKAAFANPALLDSDEGIPRVYPD